MNGRDEQQAPLLRSGRGVQVLSTPQQARHGQPDFVFSTPFTIELFDPQFLSPPAVRAGHRAIARLRCDPGIRGR
jgi:hypothetical protein